MISELLSKGYDVYLSLPKSEKNKYFEDLGCKVIETEIDRRGVNPIKDLGLIGQYKKMMKAVKPDIVLSYTIKPNVYGGIVCQKYKIPYVANVTGLGSSIQDGGRLLKYVALTLYKIALKKAEKVFFQNDSNRDFFIERKIIRRPYAVLPGSGVNLSLNPFEEYPVCDGKLVFVTIGRIMKDKGIDELLKAAETLKEKHDDLVFRLVGAFDDNYKDKIERAVSAGVIEYLGFSNEVHDIIKRSHATLHPSHHEGTSNVLLETAACGRPIIASDIPGCNNTFDDGISGIAFKPKDVFSLVEAVEKFIALPDEEKAKMGKEGRKKMEKEFDRQIVIDAYLKEINKIEG